MRKFIAFGPALVVLITVLVTLVAAPAAVRKITYAATDVQVQLARQDLAKDNILKQIDRAVRNVADAVEPSVVHVAIDEPTARGGLMRSAQGSGWVFDNLGHIITNAHVVRGASRIVVQFYDGRTADAKVVGMDPNTDVAVVQVSSTEGLVPVQRATGLELHQGDRVYAFGSPFGFKFSMSEGIVSGLGRDPRQIMGNIEGYTNFIQTDAAVNPGNSGGPLVNVEGKLVGMNVAIATAPTARGEGQNSGISFAIPLSTIERVVEQMVTGAGVVTRGYLGVRQAGDDELNQRALNALEGFHGRGVMITGVEPNGPAARGGIRAGDVVTKIDKQSISSVQGLRLAIAGHSPGERVPIEVWRDGESKSFDVELGRLISDSDKQEAARAAARFGINDVGETSDGQVLIVEIQAPSPAYQAGLRPNMRIIDVGGTPVRNLDEFFTALATGLQQGKEIPMTVETRGGQRKDVKIPSR